MNKIIQDYNSIIFINVHGFEFTVTLKFTNLTRK